MSQGFYNRARRVVAPSLAALLATVVAPPLGAQPAEPEPAAPAPAEPAPAAPAPAEPAPEVPVQEVPEQPETVPTPTAENADSPQPSPAPPLSPEPPPPEADDPPHFGPAAEDAGLDARGLDYGDDEDMLQRAEVPWQRPRTGLDAASPLRTVCADSDRQIPSDGPNDCTAQRLSDSLLALSFGPAGAVAATYSLTDGVRQRRSPRPIIGVTMSLGSTVLLTYATKLLFARPRPYTYGASYQAAVAADPTLRTGTDERSFFSGHTSFAATNLFAAATTYAAFDRNAAEQAAPAFAMYGLAAVGTWWMGHLRVDAGKHFPSDVIAGALVGAGLGVAGPLIAAGLPRSLDRATSLSEQRPESAGAETTSFPIWAGSF